MADRRVGERFRPAGIYAPRQCWPKVDNSGRVAPPWPLAIDNPSALHVLPHQRLAWHSQDGWNGLSSDDAA